MGNMGNMAAMYGLPGMQGLQYGALGAGAMAGLGAMAGGMGAGMGAGMGGGLQSYYGGLGSQLYQQPSAASYGLFPDAMGGMGAKDSFARSSMLAQMAAETAVLTSRKRKMMDSMVWAVLLADLL